MRTTFVISFALAAVVASSTAFAAGEGDGFKRRLPVGQQFLRPAVKTGAIGQAQFAPTLRPPVQTIAPRILTGPKPVAQLPIAPQIKPTAPIKAEFALPAGPTAKPDLKPFVQIRPEPVAKPPVLDVKQTLPVAPTRQIVPEAADETPAPLAPPAPTVETPPAIAPSPAVVPPAPKLVSNDPPAAELPSAETPAAPVASQAEDQADDQAAPAAPAAPATPKKQVRIYVQAESDYGYAEQDYGYQPRIRYSYDSGYDSNYGGGDGCQ